MTLPTALRNRLVDLLVEDMTDQALDDAREFIADLMLDGYQFVGYKHLTDDELVEEFREHYVNTYTEDELPLDERGVWGRKILALIKDLQPFM